MRSHGLVVHAGVEIENMGRTCDVLSAGTCWGIPGLTNVFVNRGHRPYNRRKRNCNTAVRHPVTEYRADGDSAAVQDCRRRLLIGRHGRAALAAVSADYETLREVQRRAEVQYSIVVHGRQRVVILTGVSLPSPHHTTGGTVGAGLVIAWAGRGLDACA